MGCRHVQKAWRPACLVTLLSLLCLSPTRALDQYIVDNDRFPGWKGELPTSLGSVEGERVGYGALGKEVWRGRVEQVSWKPRAFLFHDFLTEAECEHMMSLANGTMAPSTVVDSSTGGSMASKVRTSSGTWFPKAHTDIIAAIEDRIAMVTMIPAENGEGIQVLRYVNGQEYKAHTDYFHDSVNSNAAHGGQRVATMLMYLSTPEEGGETVFPFAGPKRQGEEWSPCARTGLSVKAKRGDALFFFSLKPDGSEDVSSTHGSCPTLKGTKWSATKWMHVSEFSLGGAARLCTDNNPKCEEWAVNGECKANAGYMLATCPKACGRCGAHAQRSVAGRKGGQTT